MRLAGRLSAAIEVLEDMEHRRRPVAQALKDWGLAHRFAGSADRAAIGTIVYDVLRRRRSLSWRMGCELPVALAWGALFEIMVGEKDPAALVSELADDPFAPPPLDARCLQAWQGNNDRDAPDEIQADMPPWCSMFIKDIYGDDWLAQAQALSGRPPLDMRLNPLKATFEKLAKTLNDDKAQPVSWFETAWRIASTSGFGRHPNVQATAAFQKGWFEIQDLGSQIVAHLANAQTSHQVLDYCAGGGGKTLALAAAMANRGQIYAYDADKMRLKEIFARLQRAGVRNVQVIERPQDLGRLAPQMDLVLVDAPCSGSGTWRRHPDAKWRLREAQLQRRVEEQRDILAKAKDFVRSGGQLAYITCSLFDIENTHQIEDFLETNPDFQPVNMRTRWDEVMPPLAPRPHFNTVGCTLSPASTSSDGFYISLLQRH